MSTGKDKKPTLHVVGTDEHISSDSATPTDNERDFSPKDVSEEELDELDLDSEGVEVIEPSSSNYTNGFTEINDIDESYEFPQFTSEEIIIPGRRIDDSEEVDLEDMSTQERLKADLETGQLGLPSVSGDDFDDDTDPAGSVHSNEDGLDLSPAPPLGDIPGMDLLEEDDSTDVATLTPRFFLNYGPRNFQSRRNLYLGLATAATIVAGTALGVYHNFSKESPIVPESSLSSLENIVNKQVSKPEIPEVPKKTVAETIEEKPFVVKEGTLYFTPESEIGVFQYAAALANSLKKDDNFLELSAEKQREYINIFGASYAGGLTKTQSMPIHTLAANMLVAMGDSVDDLTLMSEGRLPADGFCNVISGGVRTSLDLGTLSAESIGVQSQALTNILASPGEGVNVLPPGSSITGSYCGPATEPTPISGRPIVAAPVQPEVVAEYVAPVDEGIPVVNSQSLPEQATEPSVTYEEPVAVLPEATVTEVPLPTESFDNTSEKGIPVVTSQPSADDTYQALTPAEADPLPAYMPGLDATLPTESQDPSDLEAVISNELTPDVISGADPVNEPSDATYVQPTLKEEPVKKEFEEIPNPYTNDNIYIGMPSAPPVGINRSEGVRGINPDAYGDIDEVLDNVEYLAGIPEPQETPVIARTASEEELAGILDEAVADLGVTPEENIYEEVVQRISSRQGLREPERTVDQTSIDKLIGLTNLVEILDPQELVYFSPEETIDLAVEDIRTRIEKFAPIMYTAEKNNKKAMYAMPRTERGEPIRILRELGFDNDEIRDVFISGNPSHGAAYGAPSDSKIDSYLREVDFEPFDNTTFEGKLEEYALKAKWEMWIGLEQGNLSQDALLQLSTYFQEGNKVPHEQYNKGDVLYMLSGLLLNEELADRRNDHYLSRFDLEEIANQFGHHGEPLTLWEVRQAGKDIYGITRRDVEMEILEKTREELVQEYQDYMIYNSGNTVDDFIDDRGILDDGGLLETYPSRKVCTELKKGGEDVTCPLF